MVLTPGEVRAHIYSVFLDSLHHSLDNVSEILHTIDVVERIVESHRVLVLDGESILRAVNRELVALVEIIDELAEALAVCR